VNTRPLILAVIFDRDGVLIEDRHYAINPAEIRWTPGVRGLLELLKSRGVRTFVATNQSGIARGYFCAADVERFHLAMRKQLGTHGLDFDGVEYCPHHPTAGQGSWTKDCDCRKPKPGMIRKLLSENNINPEHALMIGDRDVDMTAAANAGVAGMLFNGGDLLKAFIDAGWGDWLPVEDSGFSS